MQNWMGKGTRGRERDRQKETAMQREIKTSKRETQVEQERQKTFQGIY